MLSSGDEMAASGVGVAAPGVEMVLLYEQYFYTKSLFPFIFSRSRSPNLHGVIFLSIF